MAEVTRQIQEVSNIPEWAQKFASQLFGMTFGDPNRPGTGGLLNVPYEQYTGQRVAGVNPMMGMGYEDISKLGVSPELRQAAGIAGLVSDRAGAMGYTPYQAQNYYQAPEARELGLDYLRTQAGPATQYQMGPGERVGAERFGVPQMQEYMSPYMQGVVEQQKRGAVQDYLRTIPQLGAQAVRAGAKGGSRQAILESEARRNLAEQLGGIESTGLQSAYQQAASQFGQDRAAQMQAALANQQMGLTTGQQNLQAQINQAQFAAQQALQAGQTNQAAQLQAQAQRLQQQQAINQFNQQNAQFGAQYGLAGQQLAEQSRQYGAGLNMQALQQQLAAAGALGGFGQQAYQQGLGAAQARIGAGMQMRDIEQAQLSNLYQDFINRQQYPYKQLEFASGILRGFQPTGTTQTLYQPSGSALGTTTAGLGSLFTGLGGFGGQQS